MKHLEIERRFLLYPCSMKRLLKSNGLSYKVVPIVQFYLVAEEGEVLRYRRCGKLYIRTRKVGSGMVRVEHEEVVDEGEFKEAMERNSGGLIRKKRFIFEFDGIRYELDSFKRDLGGLNILEVEFNSAKEAESFELPKLFKRVLAAEITDMSRFTNGALSKSMKIPSIETPLAKMIESVEERGDFLKASVKLGLAPYESTAHSIKAIFYSLLRTIDSNKEVILADTKDPERLHQLRVAMRKLRALLSQLRREFDSRWYKEHKDRLASLMRQTGPMRDIDVYLDEIEHYKKMLPSRLRPGIEGLEEYLKSEKGRLKEELLAFLGQEEFSCEMRTLMDFAKSESMFGLVEEAGKPVIFTAKKVLRQRYEKIMKMGSRIDEYSRASEYHSVRIEVKKMRYMMEFFSSLFDKDAYDEMAGMVKEIQTLLGRHQDLDVQKEHLEEFAGLSMLHDEISREAIEYLRSRMGEEERRKRAEFRESFADFKKTKDIFRRMVCKF